MAGLNKVMLIGNVGSEPEIRNLENGTMVATLSLATDESYTDKNGQKVEKVEWHRIVLWRGLAQVVEKYVKKGDKLYLEGKLRTRSYEKDGITRYSTDIQADNMVMLGGKSGSNFSGNTNVQQPANQQSNSSQNTAPPQNEGVTDISNMDDGDDLPF